MPRISIACCAVAVCFGVPALAQNTMTGPSSSASSAMTCDQMMKQADRMSVSSTGARITMAKNERHMATMAKAKGDEADCKMHMDKAMKLMR